MHKNNMNAGLLEGDDKEAFNMYLEYEALNLNYILK